jgi:hypothetical protein
VARREARTFLLANTEGLLAGLPSHSTEQSDEECEARVLRVRTDFHGCASKPADICFRIEELL